jgi:hypothetical protein
MRAGRSAALTVVGAAWAAFAAAGGEPSRGPGLRGGPRSAWGSPRVTCAATIIGPCRPPWISSPISGAAPPASAGPLCHAQRLRLARRRELVGVPGETVLFACDGADSPLACDGDCNERQIALSDPSAFRVGDGVSIQTRGSAGASRSPRRLITGRWPTIRSRSRRPSISAIWSPRRPRPDGRSRSSALGRARVAAIQGLTIEGNRADPNKPLSLPAILPPSAPRLDATPTPRMGRFRGRAHATPQDQLRKGRSSDRHAVP